MSLRARTTEAALAGVALGWFEAARIAFATGIGHPVDAPLLGTVAVAAVVAAFATLGGALGALVVLGGVALLARVPTIAAWQRALRGARRALAMTRVALVVTSVGLFGAGVFALVAWTHVRFRFHEAGPLALVVALACVGLGGALALGGLAVDRALAPRLAPRAGPSTRHFALVYVAAIAVAPPVVVALAAPAFPLAPVLTASVLLAASLAARGVRLGTHRAARVFALATLGVALVGVAASRSVPRARGQLVAQGVLGKPIARLVWHLADRDGDGYGSSLVGGADCDDADAARYPSNVEALGNGVDDNCSGADLRELGARATAVPPTGTARMNVVVITVDALRPDHLGAYGYARPTSPAIDALAAAGTRFAHAYTASPSTRAAIPALHTGRYASTIRFVDPPTLAQTLGGAGYATAAVLCCDPLVSGKQLRGFTTVDRSAEGARLGSPGQANAEAVADRAISILSGWRTAGTPALLWVHFYDPHHPYATPSEGTAFGARDIDRYDAEIAFADRGVGRLLAALDAHALASSTIVVIAADHGDEFGEHGLRFHARSLYNQVVRIPLIVRVPGTVPRVVETPASLVDIAPTIYDLVGVVPPPNLNGRSLAPALRGQPLAPRPLILELAPDRQIDRDLIGVVAHEHKVIWDREANAWSLFALSDRDDAHDLAVARPGVLATMQTLLRELTDSALGQP